VSEVLKFPVKCSICKRDIVEGMLYYTHPDHGFVGECCPQFDDGGVSVKDEE